MSEEEIDKKNDNMYPRIILGLDVSTSCIGVCVIEDNGVDKPKILYLSHKTPKVKKNIKGIEALFIRKRIFENECLSDIKEKFKVTDVIIEEPLLSSNNVYTVATLIRYNGMISDSVYSILGIVPHFITSYDARMFSFPELVTLRKYNKKGEEYPLKHVEKAIKNGCVVLFGSYPFDIDKKTVMMNMVNDMYGDEISWSYNDKGELKKENYDACDSLICALAYVNLNRHWLDQVKLTDYDISQSENEIIIQYKTEIWDKTFTKTLILTKK